MKGYRDFFETGSMPQIYVSHGAVQASKQAAREYETMSGG